MGNKIEPLSMEWHNQLATRKADILAKLIVRMSDKLDAVIKEVGQLKDRINFLEGKYYGK